MRRRLWFPGAGRVALLPPAAFAVHQLRYEIAFGGRAGVVLHQTGHSYLHSVVPWLVALVGMTVGSFLLRLGRAVAGRSGPGRRSMSLGAMWAVCACALIVIFACQETLEGIFATGHPGGLQGVFGDGGYWAVPVAVGIGLILAVVFHGASWAIRQAAVWRRRPSRLRRPIVTVPRTPATAVRPRSPLLAGPSSRGPPA